jgi:hypothetical protein
MKSKGGAFYCPPECTKKGFGHWLNHDKPDSSNWIILLKCLVGSFIVIAPVVFILMIPALYYEEEHPVIFKEVIVNGQKCTGWYRANTSDKYYTISCPLQPTNK